MQPDPENYTEKTWAAMIAAQGLAKNRYHQQIGTLHLLKELINQEGLALKILKKS